MRRFLLCFCTLCLLPAQAGEPIIEKISSSEKVTLEDHLEGSRFVIFDFYADWCSPCRKWTPILERFAEKYPDQVALKKIDIKSWGTPVALQYNLNGIPHLRLLNAKGKTIRKGHPSRIMNFLEKKAKKDQW